MIISKEVDEMDFFVVNREWTEEDRAEMSQGIAECRALSESLRAQGYSPAEIHERLNSRFADETGNPKRARLPKPAAVASTPRRKLRDSAVLTA